MRIVMTDFALSHFDATEHEPAIPQSPDDFIREVNHYLDHRGWPGYDCGVRLIADGYASFCKIIYLDNWTKAKLGIAPIDPSNESLIKTAYEARRETELPVMVRYLPGSDYDKWAKYLAVIVYDREQMLKEGTEIDGDYAVVNILRLAEEVEPPIPPITMMRNALGVEEGGSGVPLDREKYLASVAFWEKHVAVKPKANP